MRLESAGLTLLLRIRWWLWSGLAVLAALASHGDDSPDITGFAHFGSDILSGRWSAVYATPWNQSGPLQALACRFLLVGASSGRPNLLVVAAMNLGLIQLVRYLCRYFSRRVPVTALVQFLAAASATVWLAPNFLWAGHVAEIVIPILWIFAGIRLSRQGWLSAGLLFGLSAAVAPWAVIALPAALAARHRQSAIRCFALGAVVALASYAPFVLTGHFQLFQHEWPVQHGSIYHLIDPSMRHFSWPLRLLQGGASVTACAYVAVRSRAQVYAIWAPPLAAVVVRVMTDPVISNYYWFAAVPLVVAAIVTVPVHWASYATPVSRRATLSVCVLAYLPWAVHAVGLTVLACVAMLGAIAAVLGSEPDAPPADFPVDTAMESPIATAIESPIPAASTVGVTP